MNEQLKNYNPRRNGFPFKTLENLYENGGSNLGWVIKEEIGLNDWAAEKGMIFMDRAKVVFDNLLRTLLDKGLLKSFETQDSEISLTKDGIEFMEEFYKKKGK